MKHGMLGRQAEAPCQRSAGRASPLWDPGKIAGPSHMDGWRCSSPPRSALVWPWPPLLLKVNDAVPLLDPRGLAHSVFVQLTRPSAHHGAAERPLLGAVRQQHAADADRPRLLHLQPVVHCGWADMSGVRALCGYWLAGREGG